MTRRSRTLALGVGLVAALVILFVFDPADGLFYPPCLFRTFLGFTCPGCGTLRAMHQLLHGHVGAAWRLNPGVTALTPALVVGLAMRTWRGRRER